MKTNYIFFKEFFLNKSTCIIFILLFISVSAFEIAEGQLQDKTLSGDGKDFFYFDPMVFYSNDKQKARVDIYIEIPLSNLQFKKNYSTKQYDASVNYVIQITNSNKEVVTNESLTDFVTTTKSEQKNLEANAKYIIKEYFLNPGHYNIEVTLSDINTKKEAMKKGILDIVDFSQKDVSFSDIMLVSNLKEENGKKVITPLIDKNVDNLKQLYLFFEIYNSKDVNLVNNYSYQVIDKSNTPIEQGSFTYTLAPGINKFFESISTANMMFGDFKLEIKDNTSGQLIAVKEFSNKLNGIPVNMKNINTLVDQLLYIASSEELNKIKSASSSAQKEKNFIEFWRSKDPSAGTAKNELMIEYYKRINIANEKFSHYVDGWKTDMGMVFIIFGDPDNIERHPFADNSKPYEIWEYYTENRKFIFVDDTGFGDYKLTVPIWNDKATRIN